NLFTQLITAAENTGTYSARQMSWDALINQLMNSGDLTSILFGAPMGSGYGRFEGVGRWVEFAPHNWYVTVLLRTGVVGLVILAMFIGLALWKLLKRHNATGISVLVAILVFGWAYSWPWYAMIPLGWTFHSWLQEAPD